MSGVCVCGCLDLSLEAEVHSTDVLRQEKMDVSAQADSELALPWHFHSSQAQVDWMTPTHSGGVFLLYSVY